ncbi:FAD-dependent monooxygenase [Kribbella sp. NBC_01505]|uniref:FAD-dependent oxidoreductase n=1 Tax=Kribbella sp. NBC_01505 TaxID=2903580 RepID=UPI00386EF3E6
MIAIIGGGPGGLTLARVLHVHGFEAVVYERDVSREARVQGSSLDLHEDTGQAALREAGLEQQFLRFARREGQDQRVLDHTGTLLFQEDTADDAPMARPEIDRGDLRDLLLDSLPAGTVRWGQVFSHAKPHDNGWTVTFADGTTVECELLVGADGANSRVRSLLSDVRPEYAGNTLVQSSIADADRTHPELAAMVGRGNYWVFGPERLLAAQRKGDGSIDVGISLPDILDEDPDTATVAGLIDGWAPQFQRLLAACDAPFAVRPLSVLPIDFAWSHRPGVTLLGDAAHLLPPVGEGANLAMLDAADLAKAISSRPDDVESALAEYEPVMLARAARTAKMSAKAAELLSGPDAAQKVVRFFQGESVG